MDLSLTAFVLTLVVGSSVLVLLASGVSGFLNRQSERQSLRKRVICRLCLHAYEETGESGLSECPSCHTRNERGRHW